MESSSRQEVYNALRWIVRAGGSSNVVLAWATRFRRLANDYERLPETVAGLHLVAFTCLMVHRLVTLITQRP